MTIGRVLISNRTLTSRWREALLYITIKFRCGKTPSKKTHDQLNNRLEKKKILKCSSQFRQVSGYPKLSDGSV